MKKVLLKASIAIAIYALFSMVFSLLQKPVVYNNTLGKISTNYERVGNIKRYTINKVNKPFVDLTENNAYNWDARYYGAIREDMYSDVDSHFMDRYAFYPFFPIVWKLSFIRSHHIILLNYLFFALALIILSQLFMKGQKYEMFFFILSFLIPSAIVFYLPYAESLFVLTLVVAVAGLFKQKYWLYFAAMVCFSMTRPAVVILMFAFLGTDIIYFFRHRNYKHLLRQSTLTTAPVLAGWLIVTIMQYLYSGSLTTYFDTWDIWTNESGLFNKITDWSTEGFGMTSFALFFVAIPSLIYAIAWGVSSLLKKNKGEAMTIYNGNTVYIKNYMFNVSALYMVGVVIYFILTSGNVLNGFFRYTMAAPFFYIILFLLPERLEKISFYYKLGAVVLAFASLTFFLFNVHYAGDLARFEYTGLYLFFLIMPFIIFEKYMPVKVKAVILLLFIIPAVIWHTYLFNMYLSNAWIFT